MQNFKKFWILNEESTLPISVSNSLGKLVSANLTPVQRNIEESIQKLSTGARIHKGADDAASMHLASRFESKVKGLTVTISNKKDALSENIRFGLRVPHIDDLLSPILLTIPLQLLAYHVALLKNCDIDKPRNLAKSVTVE